MQFDQETIKELEEGFTALAGPDEYQITFPSSMSKRLSPGTCEEILDRTIEFAESLLAEKNALSKSNTDPKAPQASACGAFSLPCSSKEEHRPLKPSMRVQLPPGQP